MNYLKLKQKIYEAIERNPLDRSAYEEMFAVCREYEKIDFQTAHAWNHELRNHISWGLRMTVSCQKFDEAREFDDLMFRSLLFGAQHFFDDYLQAVEYGKPLDKKFYQPRRHYLRRYVDAYQEILDGKLDFLSISMPKRAGKSQLGINFTNMLSGKYPDKEMMKDGICTAIGVVGSVIASLFGGWDAALVTLVIFMAIDYVTGLLVAGVFHNSGKTENGALESRAGWKGLCRKCITLLMVLVATRLDLVTGTNFIRDAVVIAFIANETISIVENAGLMGINIPPAITSAIEVLKKKSDSVDNTDQ